MRLCLDAGNSRLKWGVHDGAGWQARGACPHADAVALASSLPSGIRTVLACNVAGAAVAAQIEALATTLGVPLIWFVSRASCCGVVNGYDEPTRLGADRWAALIAAHALAPRDALVVLAGTATTIDLLMASGTHLGGVILPGLDLMQRALAQHTAGLPLARGAFRAQPTNTADAIASGCLLATLGAIERLRAQACRLASADFQLIVSGGAAPALLPHLAPPLLHIEDLVLEGLAKVATELPFS